MCERVRSKAECAQLVVPRVEEYDVCVDRTGDGGILAMARGGCADVSGIDGAVHSQIVYGGQLSCGSIGTPSTYALYCLLLPGVA